VHVGDQLAGVAVGPDALAVHLFSARMAPPAWRR
jgi:hypothetical protein